MKHIIPLLFFILILKNANAQENPLRVLLDKPNPKPWDTLWIDIHYLEEKKPIPAASVFLVMINDNGQVWNMRWPLLNGNAQPGLIIPTNMAAGHYQLYFAARNNFFKLKGQVKKPVGLKQVKATLLAGSGDGIISNIPVSSQGSFEYNNLLFEDEARLLFSAKLNPEDLDIVIQTELDSSFLPSARVMKEFYIGEKTNRPVVQFNLDSLFMDAYSLLPAVILSSSKVSRADKLNKRYASALFNDINEKIIDVRADEAAGRNRSLLQYIRMRVPGLLIRNEFGVEPIASWRNDLVYFYIDQMRVDASTLNSIPIQDVVLIKAFPPHFFGNNGGRGGAIAIYTDRGNYVSGEARHNFTIKGYTPLLVEIPTEGLVF